MPALLTSPVSGGRSPSEPVKALSTWAASATSTTRAVAPISDATDRAASALRSMTTTWPTGPHALAPSANNRAVAAPIPLAPPVTTTVP